MSEYSEGNISSLIGFAEKLRQVERDLDLKIEAANNKLHSIIKAPLTRDDFIAAVQRQINRHALGFEAIMDEWFARDRISYEFLGLAPNGEYPYLPLEAVIRADKPECETMRFCALFGPQVMDFVSRVAARMQWSDDAIPIADRPALIAQARSEIEALTTERDRVSLALGGKGA